MFFSYYQAGLFLELKWVKLFRDLINTKKRHRYGYIKQFKESISRIVPVTFFNTIKKAIRIYNGDWIDSKNFNYKPIFPSVPNNKNKEILNEYSRIQLIETTLPVLLHWEDRNSMAHSIESRVPFLDYHLVEFVLGLPAEYKISDGITKKILRDSMNGLLPVNIQKRMDKMGFITPEEYWLRNDNPELFREALKKSIENSFGIINQDKMQYLEDMISDRVPFNFFIWRLICFGVWVKCFNVKPEIMK
jgi:asparagine synthase (glutamine-hydrolysing)